MDNLISNDLIEMHIKLNSRFNVYSVAFSKVSLVLTIWVPSFIGDITDNGFTGDIIDNGRVKCEDRVLLERPFYHGGCPFQTCTKW